MIDPPEGIVWVVLKSTKVHAMRTNTKTWGDVTLCGQKASLNDAIRSSLIDEQNICQRCQKGLEAWGYLPRPGNRPVLYSIGGKHVDSRMSEFDMETALTKERIDTLETAMKKIIADLRRLQQINDPLARATIKNKLDEPIEDLRAELHLLQMDLQAMWIGV